MSDRAGSNATLIRLIEAEQEAQQRVEAAEQRARALLAEAHRDFEVRVQQLQQEAEAEAKRYLERAREQTQETLRERATEVEARVRIMEEQAQARTADAVRLVVSWVKGEEV
ncbi:MAG: hypothetical protein JSV66_18865 [Trueperaceae bacterium]|nr:MAG: hypothetical protein JSV66_18865 [Trueperaceae bacterium]